MGRAGRVGTGRRVALAGVAPGGSRRPGRHWTPGGHRAPGGDGWGAPGAGRRELPGGLRPAAGELTSEGLRSG
ncbi:MAG TPA: hypothetical protein VGM12_17300 [Trebonia sp.]